MDKDKSSIRRVWEGLAGIFGLIAGITPHVLHHIGLIAGAVFLTGAAGSVIFGFIGLAATVPLLLKLRRRFNTMLAPAIALGVFIIMFLVSSLIIGPWIRGDIPKTPSSQKTEDAHSSHH